MFFKNPKFLNFIWQFFQKSMSEIILFGLIHMQSFVIGTIFMLDDERRNSDWSDFASTHFFARPVIDKTEGYELSQNIIG